MEINYKDVYVVRPNTGKSQQFDNLTEAWAVVREVLLAAHNEVAGDEFDGCVSWGTERVPASPFDELIADHEGELHGFDGGMDAVDRGDPFLLVEENVRGGYWLTTGLSPEALVEYHLNQEYAEEWAIDAIYDTATGKQVHGAVTHEVHF